MAHYDKISISIFQQIFTSTDKIFISGGGLSAMGIIEIFLIFRKFLRSWDLRCLTCSKAAGIYQFITNNRVSFTCGERKICSKFQNIMNMIVVSRKEKISAEIILQQISFAFHM